MKFKTIHAKLFVTYSIIIAFSTAIVTISFYYYTASMLSRNASESIFQSITHISTQLDTMIQNLDLNAVKVSSSIIFKKYFFQDSDRIFSLQTEREMRDIIFSILGYNQLDWQINIFDRDGRFFSVGNYSYTLQFPESKINSIPWVEESFLGDGRKVITPPHIDDWGFSNQLVVSLSRMFSLELGSNQRGIIEVQQSYSSIEKLVSNLLVESSGHANINENIYIFNSKGELIYPYTPDPEPQATMYWNLIQGQVSSNGTLTFNNSINHNKEIVEYKHSDYTDWLVVATESENLLLKPVTLFRNFIFFAVIGLLFIILIVSFFVARGITTPIKNMYKSVRTLQKDQTLHLLPNESTFKRNELEILDDSFKRMIIQLQNSMKETLHSRSKELEAQMIALQSQMNPHFLYNTITLISNMAEEKDQLDIAQVCKYLSGMLRYVLSTTSPQVTIEEEIKYTEKYLSLMQLRFENKLFFQINLDSAILNVCIPKLIIQPIVENCIKYGIHVNPPWNITIIGKCERQQWTIEIRDNGTGFTSETLEALNSNAPHKPFGNETMGNQLGLKNIIERLQILYGEHAVFKVSNDPLGGATVRIGGLVIINPEFNPTPKEGTNNE